MAQQTPMYSGNPAREPSGPQHPVTDIVKQPHRRRAVRCFGCEGKRKSCLYNKKKLLSSADWFTNSLRGQRCDHCEHLVDKRKTTGWISTRDGNMFMYFCGYFPPGLAPRDAERSENPVLRWREGQVEYPHGFVDGPEPIIQPLPGNIQSSSGANGSTLRDVGQGRSQEAAPVIPADNGEATFLAPSSSQQQFVVQSPQLPDLGQSPLALNLLDHDGFQDLFNFSWGNVGSLDLEGTTSLIEPSRDTSPQGLGLADSLCISLPQSVRGQIQSEPGVPQRTVVEGEPIPSTNQSRVNKGKRKADEDAASPNARTPPMPAQRINPALRLSEVDYVGANLGNTGTETAHIATQLSVTDRGQQPRSFVDLLGSPRLPRARENGSQFQVTTTALNEKTASMNQGLETISAEMVNLQTSIISLERTSSGLMELQNSYAEIQLLRGIVTSCCAFTKNIERMFQRVRDALAHLPGPPPSFLLAKAIFCWCISAQQVVSKFALIEALRLEHDPQAPYILEEAVIADYEKKILLACSELIEFEDVNNALRFVHEKVKNYVMSENSIYNIQLAEAHETIAKSSWTYLSRADLRRDLDENAPSGRREICEYMIRHCVTHTRFSEDRGKSLAGFLCDLMEKGMEPFQNWARAYSRITARSDIADLPFSSPIMFCAAFEMYKLAHFLVQRGKVRDGDRTIARELATKNGFEEIAGLLALAADPEVTVTPFWQPDLQRLAEEEI